MYLCTEKNNQKVVIAEKNWYRLDREKFFYNFLKKVNVDTGKLKKKYDSCIIFYHNNGIYLFSRKGDSLDINQILFINKKIKNEYKVIYKNEQVYSGKIDSSIVANKQFYFLFDIYANVETGKEYLETIRNYPTLPNDFFINDYYIQSFTPKTRFYSECINFSSVHVLFNDKSLRDFFLELIRKYSHWIKTDKLVKASGIGECKYDDYINSGGTGFYFDGKGCRVIKSGTYSPRIPIIAN